MFGTALEHMVRRSGSAHQMRRALVEDIAKEIAPPSASSRYPMLRPTPGWSEHPLRPGVPPLLAPQDPQPFLSVRAESKIPVGL